MHFAQRPVAALQEFLAEPFDVVVSDLAMPDMDGLSMIMEMRKAKTDTAFIMLTGTADLRKAVDAINQAEVFRFFTKPCNSALLAEGVNAAIRDVLARKKVVNENPSERPDKNGLSEVIGLAALNRLAIGAFVVDANARVLLTNLSAGQILATQDGIFLGADNVCRLSVKSDTDRLHHLIERATSQVQQADDDDETSGMPIVRPSLKRSYSALAVPLSLPLDQKTDSHGPLAVIFVTDPEKQPLPSPETMARLFGLSPAESRLAHALAEGLRVEEAAEKCGITLSTARTYLKLAFVKTNTGRQSELVKLVMTSPALI